VSSRRRTALAFLIVAACCAAAFSPTSRADVQKDAEKAGANLFRDKGCSYCHGATAAGTTRAPSLAKVRKLLTPAQIASQIQNGGQKMPAFKDSLTSDEVEKLVAWLRARHRPMPDPLPAATPDAAPSAAPNPPGR
jgi:mono/diheme cytochrome c family protein